MNRKEAMRQNHQSDVLESLGFTAEEAESLRRISMTLRRWFELECGDSNDFKSWAIERDETTDKPYMVEHMHVPASSNPFGYSNNGTYKTAIPDREAGARKRLAKILSARNARRDTTATETRTFKGGFSYDHTTSAHGMPDVSAYIQTDPRGAALYILRPGDVPEGSTVDCCYSRGICVY